MRVAVEEESKLEAEESILVAEVMVEVEGSKLAVEVMVAAAVEAPEQMAYT